MKVPGSQHITNGIVEVPRTRPTHPWIVLDQNRMRARGGHDFVTPLLARARSGELSVLVPDVALMEMSKHPTAWESTLSRSFKLLAAHPGGVVLGRSVADMLRQEIATGEPVGDLVDHDYVESFRDLVEDAARGRGPMLDRYRLRVPAARQQALAESYRDQDNKDLVLEGQRGWLLNLTDAGRKALRDGDVQLLRLLALKGVKDHGVGALMTGGATPEDAALLLSRPSIALAVVASTFCNILMWVAEGGLDSRKPSAVSNDNVDLDYVRLAVFGLGVESDDRRVVDLVDHVGAVIDMQVLDARHGQAGLLAQPGHG